MLTAYATPMTRTLDEQVSALMRKAWVAFAGGADPWERYRCEDDNHRVLDATAARMAEFTGSVETKRFLN